MYKPFVIVGVQRSGTSMIAERIGEHPKVACGWEWTESAFVVRKISAMETGLRGDFSLLSDKERNHMLSCVTEETEWLGFRRLFGASNKWLVHPKTSIKLLVDQFRKHVAWFRDHPEVAVVHVSRSDPIAWLKSKYVAKAAGAFVGEKYPESLKVHIPPREAIARLQSKQWVDDQIATLTNTNKYIDLKYEQFTENPDRELQKVYRFLDIPSAPTTPDQSTSRIRRQTTLPDKEYISNYEELCKYIERHSPKLAMWTN